MNTNTITLALGGFVALTLAVLAVSMLFYPKEDANANSFLMSNVLGVATTSTAVSVTSSTRVLATTTSITGPSYTRVYATVCNPSSTVVYLNMDQDKIADTTHSVEQIAAAAGYKNCYEITDRNLYQGSVTASSTAGAVSVLVTDYVF